MDKQLFKNNLENKKYYECTDILRKEIIKILEKRIKYYDKFFSYTTSIDLYNKVKKTLTKREINIAYELFLLDITDESEEYILDEMMKMYHELQEK